MVSISPISPSRNDLDPVILAALPLGQSGMTLIEVLVSALVMTVGLLGIYKGLIAEQGGTTYAERSAVLSQAGEQTLEAVEALTYANIADSSAPAKTTSTDTTNPTYYLSTCGANTCYQWDPTNPANTETVDVDAVNGVGLARSQHRGCAGAQHERLHHHDNRHLPVHLLDLPLHHERDRLAVLADRGDLLDSDELQAHHDRGQEHQQRGSLQADHPLDVRQQRYRWDIEPADELIHDDMS